MIVGKYSSSNSSGLFWDILQVRSLHIYEYVLLISRIKSDFVHMVVHST